LKPTNFIPLNIHINLASIRTDSTYQRRTMKLVFFLVLTAIVCSTFIEAGGLEGGEDCSSDYECDSNFCEPIWSLGIGICAGCSRDSQCRSYYNCLDGKCIDADCLNDSHCPSDDYTCRGGKCLLRCTRDSDCPTSGYCNRVFRSCR